MVGLLQWFVFSLLLRVRVPAVARHLLQGVRTIFFMNPEEVIRDNRR